MMLLGGDSEMKSHAWTQKNTKTEIIKMLHIYFIYARFVYRYFFMLQKVIGINIPWSLHKIIKL